MAKHNELELTIIMKSKTVKTSLIGIATYYEGYPIELTTLKNGEPWGDYYINPKDLQREELRVTSYLNKEDWKLSQEDSRKVKKWINEERLLVCQRAQKDLAQKIERAEAFLKDSLLTQARYEEAERKLKARIQELNKQ